MNQENSWLYIGKYLTKTQQYLVILAPRANLTLKFMLSDPMTRMIFRVLIFSVLVSILLTILMDRWVAEPIRRMSRAASSMALSDRGEIPLEGPAEVRQTGRFLKPDEPSGK